jgi:hypothetical protein
LHELFSRSYPPVVAICWWIITFALWAGVTAWSRPLTFPARSPRQRLTCALPLLGAALVWCFYISDGLDDRTRPLPTLAVLALVGAAMFVRFGWSTQPASK